MQGILNGTTNYILTQMEEGMDYEDALKQAQELGYAEAVPDADVIGWDALAKVMILANVVFGANARARRHPVQGHHRDHPGRDREARRRRQALQADRPRRGATATLVQGVGRPAAGRPQPPLAGVGGATNAITFATDLLGE